MKDDTIVGLNVLEIDLLIHMLDEVVSGQKIPDVITEEIREEVFTELDIAKILTDLKNKLGNEKFSQLEDPDTERLYIINLTEAEVYDLRYGDYGDIEPVLKQILEQVDKQNKEEEEGNGRPEVLSGV